MLEKDFHRLFRDGLADHVSEVPGDMWMRIRVKGKQRRLILFWRWYAGGILLLTTALALFWLYPRVQFRSTARNNGHISRDIGDTSRSIAPSPRTAGSPSNRFDTASRITDSVSGNNRFDTASRVTGSISGNKDAAPRKAGITDNDISSAFNASSSTNPGSSAANLHPSPAGASSASSNLRSSPAGARPAFPHHTLYPVPIGKFHLETGAITIHAPGIPRTIPCPGNPLMPHRLHRWFFDVFASPDWPITSLRRGLSYTGGVRLTRLFSSGLTASLGLQLSRINLQPGIDSLAPAAPSYFYNLDLPALIGYTWGGDDLRMAVNAGMIVNLHSWPESQPKAGTPQPWQIRYENNTGLSLYLGFQFRQNFSPRFSLLAEPYFRHPLSSAPADGSGPLRGFNVAGLSLGLRYQF